MTYKKNIDKSKLIHIVNLFLIIFFFVNILQISCCTIFFNKIKNQIGVLLESARNMIKNQISVIKQDTRNMIKIQLSVIKQNTGNMINSHIV